MSLHIRIVTTYIVARRFFCGCDLDRIGDEAKNGPDPEKYRKPAE